MILYSNRDQTGWRVLIDERGNKYGKLTVLGLADVRKEKRGSTRAFWDCECACGRVVAINGSSLRNGTSRSCGCLRSEHIAESNRGRQCTMKRDKKNGKFLPQSAAQGEDET
jgi:hypothetical protein